MKRILILAVLAILTVSCASEAEQSVKKLESFVEKLESKYESFTEENWTEATQTYEEIWGAVKENWSKLTKEQQRTCTENAGKFAGFRLKDITNKAYDSFGGAIDGLIKSLEGKDSEGED